MTPYTELTADYAAKQTKFQQSLEILRESTEQVIRLRFEVEEHPTVENRAELAEAQAVLKDMAAHVKGQQAERDRAWEKL